MRILKTGLVAIIIMLAMGVKAQNDTPKKLSFHVRGGLNISDLTATSDNKLENATSKLGFNVGGMLYYSLGNSLYLQTGLTLTSKGAKINNIPGASGNYDASMNAVYLQVPLLIAFKLQLNNTSNKIGVAVGPYFAYGITGKTTLLQDGQSTGVSYNTFQSNGLWKRPDLGFNMEASFEMPKVIFILGADGGVLRLWNTDQLANNANVTNMNVYLSLGYKF